MKKASLLSGILLLLLAVVLMPLMTACPQGPTEAQTLKIGAINSITGPLSASFKTVLDSAKPTQDLLNQRGGVTVNGQQYNIEIIVEDDKSSPPDAVAAANILIQDGVKFMVDPVFPPNVIAMGPVCEEAKVIRFSGYQLDPVMFGPETPYHFDTVMSIYQIAPYYDYLVSNYPQVKRVALIPPDDPGMNFATDFAIQQAQKHGLEVVFTERFAPDTQDFYPILTKALAQEPDVINGIGGLVFWGSGIINQSRELGFTGPIMFPTGTGDTNLLNSMLKPEYANDILNGLPDTNSDQMLPLIKEFRPLVEQTGTEFIFDSTLVLASVYVMLQGIERAQSLDTDQVLAALESMESFDTPWGKATWGGEELGGLNHMGKNENVPMTRIVNGQVQFEWLKP
jgi:branched-chain amino acid transport system substrate-binding protein